MSEQAVPHIAVQDDLPIILSSTKTHDQWVVIVQSGNGILQVKLALKGNHLEGIEAILARPCNQTRMVREGDLVVLEMPYSPLSLSGKQAGHLLFNMRAQLRQARKHELAGVMHDLALLVKNRQPIERFGIESVQNEATRMPSPLIQRRTARQHGRATPISRGFEPHQI